MLQTGARFADNFYVTTAIDPSNGDCSVAVEMVVEGEKVLLTGSVVWDEPDGDLNDGNKGSDEEKEAPAEAPAEDEPKEEVKEKE